MKIYVKEWKEYIMKTLIFISAMLIFLLVPKLTAQSDTSMYNQHTDSTKADNTNMYNQRAPATSLMMDTRFIKNAADGNMIEINLSKLAEKKATSESVKQFAKKIEDYHTNAYQQLRDLPETSKIETGTGTDEYRQKLIDLNSLSGSSFDKEYIKLMIEDHQRDIAEFQNALTTVQNSGLKSWINSTLPTLKEHLQEAQDIQSELDKM